MLKLKKGKKKKGKKDSKDDLFDPEQLAKYRREKELARQQQQDQQGQGPSNQQPEEANEEWQRFKLLTAGVDDILKKTSGDLDRIKSESFYQKKAPQPTRPSPPHPDEQDPTDSQGHQHQEQWTRAEQTPAPPSQNPQHTLAQATDQQHQPEQEEVVESVPEVEEGPISLGDELFDTSFVEAIASGEIKLAYIPESPDEPDSEDPFDTSGVADVVKKIEEANKKERRRVDLGIAVNLLTNSPSALAPVVSEAQKVAASLDRRSKRRALYNVNLLGTFDESSQPSASPDPNLNSETAPVKDVFDDLELVAPECNNNGDIELRPTPVTKEDLPQEDSIPQKVNLKELLNEFEVFEESSAQCSGPTDTAAKENESDVDEFDELALASIHANKESAKEGSPVAEELDPFDTSFVKPSASESDFECSEPVSVPVQVEVATPAKGSAATEASQADAHFEDPFDTSALKVASPCPTQLKLLADEFLPTETEAVELVKPSHVLIEEKIGRKLSVESDFDFDPRKDEPQPAEADIQESPETEPHPLDVDDWVEASVENKALTPVTEVEIDPFDTSAVSASALIPGKLELRQLESELVQQPIEATEAPVVESLPCEPDDFFRVDDQVHCSQPLNPVQYTSPSAASEASVVPESAVEFEDPFDTGHVQVKDIFTGKVEIKDLEHELLSTRTDVRPPRPQIPKIELDKMSRRPGAEHSHPLDEIHADEHAKTPLKPLSPINPIFNGAGDLDDPFDTSIADFVRPTNVEIRLLEEELQKP